MGHQVLLCIALVPVPPGPPGWEMLWSVWSELVPLS